MSGSPDGNAQYIASMLQVRGPDNGILFLQIKAIKTQKILLDTDTKGEPSSQSLTCPVINNHIVIVQIFTFEEFHNPLH